MTAARSTKVEARRLVGATVERVEPRAKHLLIGLNAQWYLGRSGRYTDTYLFSRNQRMSELEFTMTYEI